MKGSIQHNPRGPPRSSLSCENPFHLKNFETTVDLQPGCDPEMTSQLSHHPLQHLLNMVGGQSTCFDRAAEACIDWSQSGGTSPRGLHKQAWAYVEINLQCGAEGALEQITPTRQRMSSGEWIRYSGPWISVHLAFYRVRQHVHRKWVFSLVMDRYTAASRAYRQFWTPKSHLQIGMSLHEI